MEVMPAMNVGMLTLVKKKIIESQFKIILTTSLFEK